MAQPHTRVSAETPEAALARYRETGDRRARNEVVEAHRWLAVAIAREYHTGGEPLDDLIQVACMALVKAAERFDPAFGVEFKTFAAVTARGELRRYYRDSTWSMRVPRRLQELRYEVRAATEVLRERLRRSPDTGELGVLPARAPRRDHRLPVRRQQLPLAEPRAGRRQRQPPRRRRPIERRRVRRASSPPMRSASSSACSRRAWR